MKNTAIEWCDHTFNPWIGCTKISPACDHCYAERSAPARVKRAAGVETWGPNGQRVRTGKAYWRDPLKWNAEAQRTGTRPRVFCASLADVFDNAVPPEWRTDLFALIMRCENLDFLLLTKRVGNVTRMLQEVASMLRSEYGAQTEREPGLQARPVGRTGDRCGGSNLARGEADFRSLDRRDEGDTVHESSGGAEDAERLPAGAGDDRWGAAPRGSGTAGVASLQWTNPSGSHSQSQGRREGSESPGQLGAGDVQRAATSCGAGAGGQTPRREGIESPEGAGIGGGRPLDASPAREGMAREGHCREIWDDPERGVTRLSRQDLDTRADLLAWIEQWLAGNPPLNVWLGITVCNQEEADRDIPKLLDAPAAKRFLSIEPMLGHLTLREVHSDICEIDALTGDHGILRPLRGRSDAKIHWVIVGGESGPGARPIHPDWVRGLRDQCTSAGVPFFFKQWGEWRPPKEGEEYSTAMGRAQSVPAFIIALTGTVHCFENHPTTDGGSAMLRVGKKSAGRLLDGREWGEVPV